MKQGIMKTVCSLWLMVCSIVHASAQPNPIIEKLEPFKSISSTAAIVSSLYPKHLPDQLTRPVDIITQAIQAKHIQPQMLSKSVQDLGSNIGWCLPRQYVECCILARIIQKPDALDSYELADRLSQEYGGFLREATADQAVYDLCGWDNKLLVDNTEGVLKQEALKIFCKHPRLTWQESADAKIYLSRDLTPMKELSALAWIFFDRTFLKEQEQEQDFTTFFSHNPTGFQDSSKGIQAIITSLGGHFGWNNDIINSQVDILNGQLFNLKKSTK